jgi:hypothetical protein
MTARNANRKIDRVEVLFLYFLFSLLSVLTVADSQYIYSLIEV